MKHYTGILLLTLFLFAHARAQFDKTDSTAATSTPPADTLRHFTVPIPYVGSIERSPTVLVTDSSINFMDYTYSGSLLSLVPGVFIRSLASPGQHHGITIDGLDDRNIAFMSDGVLLNEPFTGTFDPYLYPTENIERVEIITGPRAFLYGLNSTGMAVNFVSKSKKAIHASTRIRYQESSYGQGFVDGMFSQDIIRGLNMTAGAQHATYGGRYPNSDYDAWNGRMKLRYNLSNNLDFFISGMYNQTRLGLNGGIDISKTPDSTRYDRLLAVVTDSSAYEKVTRYDLQVGMGGNFFADSTSTTMLTLYHSTNFREYRDNESYQSAGYVKEDTRSQWYGARLTQHLLLGENPIDVGTEIQSRGIIARANGEQNRRVLASLFGGSELRYQQIRFSPYFRFNQFLGWHYFSYGADVNLLFNPTVTWTVGYSTSSRFPTFQEYRLADSTVALFEQSFNGPTLESHSVFQGSFQFTFDQMFAGIRFYHDEIREPNLIVPYGFQGNWPHPYHIGETINELSLMVNTHVGGFYCDINAAYMLSFSEGLYGLHVPRWRMTGGIYYWDRLFSGHLNLKTGFRVKSFSSYFGTRFDANDQVFVSESSYFSLPPDIPGAHTLDFLLIAHIGSAYVHLVMENLFDRKYVVTSFYPMNERNLRFGLSWDFFD